MTSQIMTSPLPMILLAMSLWIVGLVARFRQAVWRYVVDLEIHLQHVSTLRAHRRFVLMRRLHTSSLVAAGVLWLTLWPNVPAATGTLGVMAMLWSLAWAVTPKFMPWQTSSDPL